MMTHEEQAAENIESLPTRVGEVAVRYGLVLVILWFALMKFTNVEAEGLKPLVGASFAMGWTYHFLSAQAFSRMLGITELIVALLIALRPVSAKASAIGGIGAVGMFLTTLSFLLDRAHGTRPWVDSRLPQQASVSSCSKISPCSAPPSGVSAKHGVRWLENAFVRERYGLALSGTGWSVRGGFHHEPAL